MKAINGIVFPILAIFLLFSCDPDGKKTTNDETDQAEPVPTETVKATPPIEETKEKEVAAVKPHHFICYKNDEGLKLAISIGFNEEDEALSVKYKGQKESMKLEFKKEEYLEGGAYPTIETYYSEIYEGKENGTYKLTHSGNWDYAVYTRGQDSKVFNFTIDQELLAENGGYWDAPCE